MARIQLVHMNLGLCIKRKHTYLKWYSLGCVLPAWILSLVYPCLALHLAEALVPEGSTSIQVATLWILVAKELLFLDVIW